jgi:hypothetical protein
MAVWLSNCIARCICYELRKWICKVYGVLVGCVAGCVASCGFKTRVSSTLGTFALLASTFGCIRLATIDT